MNQAETATCGEGRFFVVEDFVLPSVRVENESRTDPPSPLNQVHRIDVQVPLPDEMDGACITTVDV